MLILALDTCDSRGSVAVLRDSAVLGVSGHETEEDYSGWLLPAVKRVLQEAGVNLADIELFCAAGGPGSFTGLRVGLTTVKAWIEVYRRPAAAVSRLEAIAALAGGGEPWVASFVDAHRGQVFGALCRRRGESLERIGDELAIGPEEFVRHVDEVAANEPVAWASLDPEMATATHAWRSGRVTRPAIARVAPQLAVAVGRLGLGKAKAGEVTDALRLDANYVRRSDAEIFWKGNAAHAK